MRHLQTYNESRQGNDHVEYDIISIDGYKIFVDTKSFFKAKKTIEVIALYKKDLSRAIIQMNNKCYDVDDLKIRKDKISYTIINVESGDNKDWWITMTYSMEDLIDCHQLDMDIDLYLETEELGLI